MMMQLRTTPPAALKPSMEGGKLRHVSRRLSALKAEWQLIAQPKMRLHVGGVEPRDGWTILNARPGRQVDIIGNIMDMSAIEDESVSEIYASHILEHLGYREELPVALAECRRVLAPRGKLAISVPDFDTLIDLYREPEATSQEQWLAISMIFGGQKNTYDYHRLAATFPLMKGWLERAGFERVQRHGEFQLFNDASQTELRGRKISLNMLAFKPASQP